MSAIWGAVNLTGGEIAKEEIRLLKGCICKMQNRQVRRDMCTAYLYGLWNPVFCATGKRGAITLHGVRYLLYGGCCAG